MNRWIVICLVIGFTIFCADRFAKSIERDHRTWWCWLIAAGLSGYASIVFLFAR
jgi:hypothetical protein